ncbi:hypothetical protein VTJ04DRAFT_7448 [Mycothermus thermophilus]|uniref:uncharacterized protein n=1 Tax=Humicola insolens TaxID=85995 RepID=UPI00374228EA
MGEEEGKVNPPKCPGRTESKPVYCQSAAQDSAASLIGQRASFAPKSGSPPSRRSWLDITAVRLSHTPPSPAQVLRRSYRPVWA